MEPTRRWARNYAGVSLATGSKRTSQVALEADFTVAGEAATNHWIFHE
jgi:hypothetical protein